MTLLDFYNPLTLKSLTGILTFASSLYQRAVKWVFKSLNLEQKGFQIIQTQKVCRSKPQKVKILMENLYLHCLNDKCYPFPKGTFDHF